MIHFNPPTSEDGYQFRKRHIANLEEIVRSLAAASAKAILPEGSQLLRCSGVAFTIVAGPPATLTATDGYLFWRAKNELFRFVAPTVPIETSGPAGASFYIDTVEVFADTAVPSGTIISSITERVLRLADNDRFVSGDLTGIPAEDRIAADTAIYDLTSEIETRFANLLAPPAWLKVGDAGCLQFVTGQSPTEANDLYYRKDVFGRVWFRGSVRSAHPTGTINSVVLDLQSVPGYLPIGGMGLVFTICKSSGTAVAADISSGGGAPLYLYLPSSDSGISGTETFFCDSITYSTN